MDSYGLNSHIVANTHNGHRYIFTHICRSSYCRCFRDSWVVRPHCIPSRPKKSRALYVSIACETLHKGGFSGASSGPNRFSLFDFKQKLDLPSRDSCCSFWAPHIMNIMSSSSLLCCLSQSLPNTCSNCKIWRAEGAKVQKSRWNARAFWFKCDHRPHTE
jgi:hypothetical protein